MVDRKSVIDYCRAPQPSESPINIGARAHAECRANLPWKNVSTVDLNLTLQGYEFDHEPPFSPVPGNWLNFRTTLGVASGGSPLPSRCGGTNFDTFEFLVPFEVENTLDILDALNPQNDRTAVLNTAPRTLRLISFSVKFLPSLPPAPCSLLSAVNTFRKEDPSTVGFPKLRRRRISILSLAHLPISNNSIIRVKHRF